MLSPLVTLALGCVAVHADTLLEERFAYPDGRLVDVSGGLWTSHSGTLPLEIASGLARINQANATGGREDISRPLARPIDPVADNVTQLYAGFTVNFSALPYNGGSSTAGSYFAHFRTGSANQFYGRIGANAEGALPGTFRLAVANSDWTSATSIEYPEDLQLGVTYEVMMRFDLGTDTATLWVNPQDESSVSVTAYDPVNYSGAINAFSLRQGTSGSGSSQGGPGTLEVGNLRIATSFAELRAIPEPSTATLLWLGGVALLVRARRREV